VRTADETNNCNIRECELLAQVIDRIAVNNTKLFIYCSWHHLTTCRPLTWNSPAWRCATDSVESFKWPTRESHNSLQYNYQLMQDFTLAPRITSPIETIERKGDGLTAIIKSKFLMNATLFTDNVSNVAEQFLHSLCVCRLQKCSHAIQLQQYISKPPWNWTPSHIVQPPRCLLFTFHIAIFP